MRKVLSAAALSLFLAVNLFAVEPTIRERQKEPPTQKIVRLLTKVVRSLGDALVIPRP